MKAFVRDRLVGLFATLGLLALVVGTPVLLVAIGANPITEPFTDWGAVRSALTRPDDGTLFLRAVAAVAWIAWAVMATLVVLEVASLARGISAPRLPGLRLSQQLARHAVGVAALLFVAAPSVQPQPTAPPVTPTPVVDVPMAHAAHVAVPASHAAGHAEPVETKPHPVQQGDTLWSIARTHLDDGARYHEIVDLNRDVLGDNPGFLEIGWVLQVPVEAGPVKSDVSPIDLNPGERVVTVEEHDTLSAIAETELDNAAAYPRIFEASRDVVQPNGARLVDADIIDVGWTVVIPADRHARAAPEHDKQDRPAPTIPAPAPVEPAPPQTQPPMPATPPADEPAPDATAPDLDEHEASVDDESAPPWLVLGLTGGGVVLAAGLYRGLRLRRRAQWRARRPGRAIAQPSPALAPVEKTINAVGPDASITTDHLDEMLRYLARVRAHEDLPMPSLAAVELSERHLLLHLTQPIALDAPWAGTPDRLHWRRARDSAVGPDTDLFDDQPAPYPLLVTIGTSDDGHLWLLNCEELGTTSITGSATRVADFARYLAAELAVNPWSQGVHVDCVGVAHEVASMNRERIHIHDTTDGETRDVLTATLDEAHHTIDRADGTDIASARAAQSGEDVWPARVLLIAVDEGRDQLGELTRLAIDRVGETGTAVLVVHGQNQPGSILNLSDDGRVRLDEAGLDLNAVGLTSDEAHGCALLLAQADCVDDVETAVDPYADGWESFCTETGTLRPECTQARGTATNEGDEPSSLLPKDDAHYLVSAATTPDDLAALAPDIPDATRADVEGADPTLDDDLRDWRSPDIRRPRLTLLGPVSAKTYGKALAKRKAFYTEILTYLALRRRHGATIDELATAFNLTPQRVRIDVNMVRNWLAVNPATGEKHLPDAQEAPSTKSRGVNVYQVDDGLLIDADLFKRLWARGQSRGSAGIDDLRQALELVIGRPFSQLRPAGWRWMDEGDRVDMNLTMAIADVAHLVTTHALANDDLELARFAVEKSKLVAPDEDTTQLNRAALAEAEGRHDEAERILRDEVCNRSDDGLAPHDITARADAILRNRKWLATG